MNRRGFTVVELLIVIVVIGIIAAIIVVAYNGIQERAESTKIISRAGVYAKGLKLWEVDQGRPTTSSCIAPSSYVTCSINGWGVNQTNDAIFNATLNQYSGLSVSELTKYGPDTPVGVMFYHSNWWGGNRGVLGYRVGPSSDCGLNGVLQSDHVTPATVLKYTTRTSTYTICEVEIFKY